MDVGNVIVVWVGSDGENSAYAIINVADVEEPLGILVWYSSVGDI